MVYLDHNATTYPLAEILDYEREIFTNHRFLNASSIHSLGRKTKHLLENARESILENLNAKDYDVIFTSCGTESNNLALNARNTGLILCQTEHQSIIKTKKQHTVLPVYEDGTVNNTVILQAGNLVSVAHANNQTGVLQNIEEISNIVHNTGALLHCDMVQSAGKVFLDLAKIGADIATLSGHKIHSIQGCGVLLKRKDINIDPIFSGGGQEYSIRPGTQNIASSLCFAKALNIVNNESYIAKYQHKCNSLINFLEQKIKALGGIIIAESTDKICNTRMICMSNIPHSLQMMKFDGEKIAVSNGAACSSGSIKTSHVLSAMGISKEIADCTIRISIDMENTQEEIEHFINTWQKIYTR